MSSIKSPAAVKRINEIPTNLVLTASYGGRNDELINEYGLKHSIVTKELKDDLPTDYNDDYARQPNVNFYLLDQRFLLLIMADLFSNSLVSK